jgi:SAM-dependent methyltransferase
MNPTPASDTCPTCGDTVAAALCRVCGRVGLASILCLGRAPLANEFLPLAAAPSSLHPLHLLHCAACELTQLARGVAPERLFTEYAYFSSASSPVVDHGTRLRAFVTRTLQPDTKGLVVEIGSNDGYLLREYAAAGHPVLGIDPARNVAELARARGVPTLDTFFTHALAKEIRRDYGPAEVVHASNVLAHAPDPVDLLSGVRVLLEGGGHVVIEVPYVRELVVRGLFDTVYHEHLFYYSFTAIHRLLEAAGLTAVYIETVPAHGGSLRVVAGADPESVTPTPARLLADEHAVGMGDAAYYAAFGRRVNDFLDAARGAFAALAADGRTLAGFGAAAKASIMVAATGAPLQYICDSTHYKQGKVLPGTRIPVHPPEHLRTTPPDYCLVFPWNHADVIIDANQEYLRRGGVFVRPDSLRLLYVTAHGTQQHPPAPPRR